MFVNVAFQKAIVFDICFFLSALQERKQKIGIGLWEDLGRWSEWKGPFLKTESCDSGLLKPVRTLPMTFLVGSSPSREQNHGMWRENWLTLKVMKNNRQYCFNTYVGFCCLLWQEVDVHLKWRKTWSKGLSRSLAGVFLVQHSSGVWKIKPS